MAYDPARGEVVLASGSNGATFLDDTWVWDGSNWVERHPVHPAPDGPSMMAFDAATQQVVWYWGEYDTPNRTWTWDGTDWHEVVVVFAGRSFATLSSDRDGVMLLGGLKSVFEDYIITRTTYGWDGETWRYHGPTNKPAARAQAAMAYDAARDEVVLFGGKQWNQLTLGDTVTWDGTNWSRRSPASSPQARYWHAMVYDSTRHQVVMFGGTRGYEYCHFDDTWTWDGVTWTEH
jgi:hypothetical protein